MLLSVYVLLAKRAEHFRLNTAVYGLKRKSRPTQVYREVFKMKVTPSLNSYMGI